MAITVSPETFDFVSFDAAYIARIAQHVAEQLGVTDIDFAIEIDETSALNRISTDASGTPVRIMVHSGAFEDKRRPRQQSEIDTTLSVARCMLRARDRIRGGFGDAPAEADLTLPQAAAWDTWIIARLARLDMPVKKQAWQYNWRNRHGFNDRADAAFEQMWEAESMDWARLCAASDAARSVSA